MNKETNKYFEAWVEDTGMAQNKEAIFKLHETLTGEKLGWVDRLTCIIELMVNRSVKIGKYHYILKKK